MQICIVFVLFFVGLFGTEKQPLCFSDNGIVPPLFESIAKDKKLFANFKRDPLLSLFMENATEEEGRACLVKIGSENLLEMCRRNDQIGNPKLLSYGKLGKFSPTSLRYAKIAQDLQKEFGSLDGLRLVEIGGGYGGLCAMLSSLYSFKSYAIVDLPQNLALCGRYLEELQLVRTTFSALPDLPDEEADLVVSYFTFSESDRTMQKRYLDKILSRAKTGYLICSPAHWKEIPFSETEHKRVKPLPREKILEELKKRGIEARCVPEDPLTGKDHYVIIWKR